MPAVLEGAVPPPHLHHLTSKPSWSKPVRPYKFPNTPSPSPLPMTPESMSSYIPHLHDDSVPGQDLGGVPTTGWFGPSAPAPDQHQTSFAPFSYDQSYVTPHTSSIPFSPPQKTAEIPASLAGDQPITAYSPASVHSRLSESRHAEFTRTTEVPYMDPPRTLIESSAHLQADTNPPTRPRSSPSTFTPNQASSAPIDFSWAVNPLGISTPNMQEQYYSGSTYPSVRSRSPRFGGSPLALPATNIAAPQPRRMYTPIAPHPLGPQRTSVPKRYREDDEPSEQSRKRKRSDSNTTNSMELGEEDQLLIKLKDEECMPWKDIAARFQSEMGKTYQIPALQMRLKRLRERMRVWTETDVRALRMAHEYWVQSKFDIISQKMLEFGAAEKWTARQCARKWAEIDPGPTPYTTYEHHPNPSYASYTMSPVEAPAFLPYLHIP